MSSFAFGGTVRTDFPEFGVFGCGYPLAPTTSGTIGVPPYNVVVPFNEPYYWQVKNYSASVSISAGAMSVVGGVMTPVDRPTDELDLCDGLPADAGFTLGLSGGGNGTFSLDVFASGLYMRDGDDFYPAISIAGFLNDGSGNEVYFNTSDTGFATGNGSITATFDGRDVTLYYNGTGTYSVGACDISIEEYWNYSP